MGFFNWFNFGKKQEVVKNQDPKSVAKTDVSMSSKNEHSKIYTPTKQAHEVNKSALKASPTNVQKPTSHSNDSLLTDPFLSPLSPISPLSVYERQSSTPEPERSYCAPAPEPTSSYSSSSDSSGSCSD